MKKEIQSCPIHLRHRSKSSEEYMKRIILFAICLIVLVGIGVPQVAFAREFSPEEKNKIECAWFKMGVLANYFDVNRPLDGPEGKNSYAYPDSCGKALAGKKITVPDWFQKEGEAKELEAMEELKVVYMPGEAVTLSEATLWFRALSNVWAYLDLAKEAVDADNDEQKQPILKEELARRYVDNRIKFVANLDRLNKELVRKPKVYNMKDSMNGRASAMLATLELINDVFFSTIESLGSTANVEEKGDKYRQAVMAVVALSNQLWREFRSAPLPTTFPDQEIYKVKDSEQIFNLLLLLLGAFLMGCAVYLLLAGKREEINRGWEQYRAKSMIWAEDFNRQFLTIDVKYIVFGTLGVFAAFGLLMGLAAGGLLGLIIFALFLVFGAYMGIQMPRVVLEHLKRSRGAKINKQLMDALILLSNSLRSGMDIVQGFELVSHDMLPPIADEFGLVIKNYQLGTPFEKALEGLDERVESRMLSYTIKAILIQRQVGGNLTIIFSRLVENIREESKLEEKLDAMTAQQRIQARVVGIMPVVMVAVMFMFRPQEMASFYFSPVGVCVLFGCLVWIMIGMKLIQKMGEVRV